MPNSNSTGYLFTVKNSSGTETNALAIERDGKVGIGTTDPNTRLHFKSNGSANGNGAAYFEMDTASNYPVMKLQTSTGGNVNEVHGLYLRHTAAGHAMRILGNAAVSQVGISMAANNGNADLSLLRVDGNVGATRTGYFGFDLKYIGSRSGVENSFSIMADNQQATDQIEALTVLQDGKTGINSGVPTDRFEVHDTYGQLFSVSDDLSSIVFSANDASGLPMIEAKADGKLLLNKFNQGNVGIGNSSPYKKLHVGSALSSTPPAIDGNADILSRGGIIVGYSKLLTFDESYWTHAYLNYDYTNNPNEARFRMYGYYGINLHTRQGYAVTIKGNNNNVGIGTTEPQQRLDVDGIIRQTSNVVSNSEYTILEAGSDRTTDDYGGLNKAYWKIKHATPPYLDGSSTTSESSHHAYSDLRISSVTGSNTTYVNHMTIRYGGNVGIGTVLPDTLLHLKKTSGSNLVTTEVAANSTVGFDIKKTGSTTQHWRIADGQTTNGNLEFYDVTDSRSVMTFDGSGNVGIGHNGPSHLLSIKGTSGVSTIMSQLWNTNSSWDAYALVRAVSDTQSSGQPAVDWGFYRGNSTDGNSSSGYVIKTGSNNGTTTRLFVRQDGNVGIGTVSPQRSLHVVGNYIRTDEATNPTVLLRETTNDREWGVRGLTDKLTFMDHGNNATYMAIDTSGHVTPGGDNTQDLGSSSKRWANLYVGDVQFDNTNTGGNDIDGTEGSWTLQEGEEDIFFINRKNGKRFKIKMEEVE